MFYKNNITKHKEKEETGKQNIYSTAIEEVEN